MQDFADLMETVTVKRISVIDDQSKARQEVQESTFEILANVQPTNHSQSGNTTIERTLNKGSYALGEALVITSAVLHDAKSGKPDIVLYDGNKYEVFTTKIYKAPLEHFEYVCLLKI